MTENPRFSRLRNPVGRLRDLPIWSKLGLIMIVPTIATIVVGTAGLIENVDSANGADRTRTLSRLSEQAGGLIHDLQNERAAAILLAGSPEAGKAEAKAAFDKVTPQTDKTLQGYQSSRSAVADVDDTANPVLKQVDGQLSDIPVIREQLRSDKGLAQSNLAHRYQEIVDGLLSVKQASARLTNEPELSVDQQNAYAISEQKEFLTQERIVVLRALAAGEGGMTSVLQQEFDSRIALRQEAEARFKENALPSQKELFEQTLSGGDLRKAVLYEGQVGSAQGAGLTFTAVDWDSAMSAYADRLREVEHEMDEAIVERATIERDNLQRTVLVETGLLLAMLLLAILFAWLVARSMARSLRELRHGALTVAQYGLPQAVARLRDPALAIQSSPDQVARQISEPLPVRSRDEFGQVTEAFNAVHLEAVRTAAEQAQLRASVATMFVNLARRSQILVDRLIGHLDRLERGEEDPDRLAELFQLDHLATRMRRNDENLLVLAGADSSRVQREPAPLMDVLRAAQSEVEHYTRIEFGTIDRDVEIAAHAVNDMVHLIAELLDNATAFSPPDSAVVVEARRVGDRAVLLVEDRGIGISPDQMRELNDKLANPPVVDVAVSRMMGLVVVARLAARHGVKVELRRAQERGTVADIALPAGVLVQRAMAGRTPTSQMPMVGAGAGPAPAPERQLPPSLPPQPAPTSGSRALALEGSQGIPTRQSGFQSAGAGANGLTPAGVGPSSPSAFVGNNGPVPGNGALPSRPQAAPTSGGAASGGFGGFSKPPSGGDRPMRGGGDAPPPARPGPQRALPPWSDLTGATPVVPNNGNGTMPPPPVPAPDSSLPQRRAGDHWTVDGEVSSDQGAGDNGSLIPRQRPTTPEAFHSGPPAGPATPPPALPPAGSQSAPLPARPTGPLGGPPSGPTPPPAWPPVAPTPSPEPEPAAADSIFGPAVDMTAEIPRLRDDWEPPQGSRSNLRPELPSEEQLAAMPAMDETMELPIFRSVESKWFSTKRPSPMDAENAPSIEAPAAISANGTAAAPSLNGSAERQAPTAPAASEQPATPPSGGRAGGITALPTRPTTRGPNPADAAPFSDSPYGSPPSTADSPYGTPPSRPAEPAPSMAPAAAMSQPGTGPVPGDRVGPGEQVTWRTAADEGWQAAEAIVEERDFSLTETGLPKRVPMSQLVPGGIEKSTTTAHRRTPEGVRGLLSAYHRGVQRGRTSQQPTTADSGASQAGARNPQGGKEHEA
ncbi:sensor histidine kinase [Virgisporangium aliadipatigenens]|nr:sensor histidine kinase [Virgisporangium aliadipatigenens]